MIQHQLRLIRTNSRELGKSDWYGWKSKWIDGLLAAAEKTFMSLTSVSSMPVTDFFVIFVAGCEYLGKIQCAGTWSTPRLGAGV